MDLNLTRVDYTQVGLTNPKTMRLLPPPNALQNKFQQKVAVGDNDGILQVFSLKKREVVYNFKTLPTKPIVRLELGGALGILFISRKNFIYLTRFPKIFNKIFL